MKLNEFFEKRAWQIVHRTINEGRVGLFKSYLDLGLKETTLAYLSQFKLGIYGHQKEAIEKTLENRSVCMATSTASGKSMVFYVSAIEMLSRNPRKKVLAIYPLKALGNEQEKKWRFAVNAANLPLKVGRIDGGTPRIERLSILRECSIIVMTPDIIHAWLLSNTSSKSVIEFLRNTGLIILDEAHTYTGVFGSNSAFLLRRLNHLILKLGGSFKYISASGTIKEPKIHLQKLVGIEFDIIDQSSDTSPSKNVDILLVNPPETSDLLSSMSELFRFCATSHEDQFIAFVDSRKQTEYLASICARQTEAETVEEDSEFSNYEQLEKLQICPYRAGYEEADRAQIQENLSRGKLRGVISTSALEMGIDIPGLTIGVLLGVPASATSLFQRIGRVGRHKQGLILIVNDGTISTRAIFRTPESLFHIPFAESALYLENTRIQYIHALCLARQGGEDENIPSSSSVNDLEFVPYADFPIDFVSLCNSEIIGELTPELQTMKAQAGDDPNHAFPLRDIDTQFQVEYRRGPEQRRLGALSHAQLMREAYPGAVYYYQASPYRVFRINRSSRTVEVRSERRYTTRPSFLPTLIFPNLASTVFDSFSVGDLTVVECNLQVSEAIVGFKERRGPNELQISYPLDPSTGLFYDIQKFQRNVFTSGVIFSHKELTKKNVHREILAQILYEAFLMTVPFERQDVSFGDDKHRADRGPFRKDCRFISVYDQTYGSLRLTSRLMEHSTLVRVFEQALELARDEESFSLNPSTKDALRVLYEEVLKEKCSITLTSESQVVTRHEEKVILPGSMGLDLKRDNEEFSIDNVFFSPQFQGIAYHGKHLTELRRKFNNCQVSVPAKNIVEIPGITKFGLYNYETGRTTPIE